MISSIKVEKYKIYTVLVTIIFYLLWILIYDLYDNRNSVYKWELVFFSWIGIIVIILYIIIWYKLTGKIFTLFNIFLAFLSVFNFGQCFLWAFGINTPTMIGEKLLYGVVDCNNNIIVKAQLLFIISFIVINCGALCYWSSKKIENFEVLVQMSKMDDRYSFLYWTSWILSWIVIPVTLFNVVQKFIWGQLYSYNDLYYGEIASASSTITGIISSLFLSCLLGLLIGSNYKKRVRIFVYSIFGFYMMISLLTGDRGEWITSLIVLFWTDWYLYKKRKPIKLVALLIFGYFCLYIVNAIVSLRNIGFSLQGLLQAFSFETAPFVPLLEEFGYSMAINIILIKDNLLSPYGNTYWMSIPTIFSTSLANALFGINYVQIQTWFPFQYLHINYGTDFTIIGEAVLNYGVYLAPIVLLIVGVIIAIITNYPYRKNVAPLKFCLALNIVSCIFKMARSSVWYVLNRVCYTTIVFFIVYQFIQIIIIRRTNIAKIK